MAKIWEVDFTVFSGASDVAVDNVGTQDLITPTGTVGMTKVSPLPGFLFRPGLSFPRVGTGVRYEITASDSVNAIFSDSYNQRSFVCFYYASGSAWGSSAPLWADFVGSTFYEGWKGGSSSLAVELGNSTVGTYPNSFITTSGWKLAVITVDKLSTASHIYGRSEADDYNSGLISQVPFTSATRTTRIGASSTSKEMKGSLGYVATYDNILTSGTVDNIWNTFLTDSLIGNPPAVVSGIVYDDSEVAVSGADVFLVYNSDLTIGFAGYDVTTSSGTYEIDVPLFGDYTLASSNPPNDGARAVSFTLSGTPGSGSITFHDGS